MWTAGAPVLGPSAASSPKAPVGPGLEMEQLGLQPVRCSDTAAVRSFLTWCATVPAQGLTFLFFIVFMPNIR